MRERERGLSLVEVLVALFLLQIALLALVPMFLQGSRGAAASRDMADVSAIASARMEALRDVPFDTLTAGGDLTASVSSFSDTSDPDYTVRWRIVDDATPPTLKTVEVRVFAHRAVLGRQKEITLTNQMAQVDD